MNATPNAESANERLIRRIEEHITSEKDAIELYRLVQVELPDPVLATIMRLIVEDEEHHHRALRRMVTALGLAKTDDRAIVPQLGEPESAPSVLTDIIAGLEAA